MPFVKLDCNMLRSTLWYERLQREIFITALLMAEPVYTDKPMPQINVRSLEETGWSVPPSGERAYGFVAAAGVGIVRHAIVSNAESDIDEGLEALDKLGQPEQSSRTPDFDGRRLVRVDGGYVVLNYGKYRERDYTAAERQKRHREKQKARNTVTSSSNAVTSRPRNVTSRKQKQSTEAEEIYMAFPLKVGKPAALRAIRHALSEHASFEELLQKTKAFAAARNGDVSFCPNPSTWFNQERFNDDPETWKPKANTSSAVKLKHPAPIYPTLPPKREPTEDEWKAHRKIAREASEQFKQQQNR